MPLFLTSHKHSEYALIQVVQEAYIQCVSTRKLEKLVQSFGIEHIFRGLVSELDREPNEQVDEFRNRTLKRHEYPLI